MNTAPPLLTGICQIALASADPGALAQPEFTRFVDAEIVKWGKVITAANVKLD